MLGCFRMDLTSHLSPRLPHANLGPRGVMKIRSLLDAALQLLVIIAHNKDYK